MKQFVLDASITLGWILDKPVPAQALRTKHALSQGARAVVPALWNLEIANSLAVAERRGIVNASDVMLALQLLEGLYSQSLDVEPEVVPMRRVLATARLHQLPAYDSVYLDLAHRLKLPLATLDNALRAAAVKTGVELLR
ncbi:MAG TPA: type II toxin-antitoxin system VapC family toxin [Candidatus Angelobacter sp.]|jgi:predicted nucleic acid-binding protein|nr:type II toxin-antitoxin system VapC family toxin [Candidatus Angelobacter sp.]